MATEAQLLVIKASLKFDMDAQVVRICDAKFVESNKKITELQTALVAANASATNNAQMLASATEASAGQKWKMEVEMHPMNQIAKTLPEGSQKEAAMEVAHLRSTLDVAGIVLATVPEEHRPAVLGEFMEVLGYAVRRAGLITAGNKAASTAGKQAFEVAKHYMKQLEARIKAPTDDKWAARNLYEVDSKARTFALQAGEKWELDTVCNRRASP